MSEQNVYKELYEKNKEIEVLQMSLQNIYTALYPVVSPEGVQLTLQEILELTLQKLGETTPSEDVKPEAKKSPTKK